MRDHCSERGGAPTLAIFTIFVIISAGLVVTHLQNSSESEVSSIQLLMASDVAEATSSSIEAELEDVLYTSAAAAMYDVGTRGGFRENVENRVTIYLNDRIELGWNYANLKVEVPKIDENSIVFDWQPNGSLKIRVYLESEIEHVKGPTVYGITLNATLMPRFQRIKHVAYLAEGTIESAPVEQIAELEKELNEKYECEGIKVELFQDENQVEVKVIDIYGSKIVNLESESE